MSNLLVTIDGIEIRASDITDENLDAAIEHQHDAIFNATKALHLAQPVTKDVLKASAALGRERRRLEILVQEQRKRR